MPRWGLIVLMLTAPCAMAQPASLDAPTSTPLDAFYGKTCQTAGCHAAAHQPGALPHLPWLEGQCLQCHQSHSDATHAPLREGGDQLCVQCHPSIEMKDAATAHPPGGQSCLECHYPHQGRIRNLLRSESLMAACADCHADFLAASLALPYAHRHFDPRSQCGLCHDAHSQSANHYLRPNVSETCLTCHDLPIMAGNRPLQNIARELASQPVVHAAIKQAGCPACHTPHGSRQPSLLKDEYPGGNYAPYRTQDYGLCWECHSSKLVEAASDPEATDFRNGPKNLHAVHVVQLKRGRSCHLCHTPHASSQPHLMRTTLRFKEWVAPLEWKPLPDGGQCASPCHQEREYHRLPVAAARGG